MAVLILSGSDVVELLSLDVAITAVEQAFRLHAEGVSLPPGVLSIPAGDGGFHIKAAGLRLARPTSPPRRMATSRGTRSASGSRRSRASWCCATPSTARRSP